MNTFGYILLLAILGGAWTIVDASEPAPRPQSTPFSIQADTTGRDSTADASSDGARWQDDVWNEIAVVHGIQFAYLYYMEADTVNDGVVVRLHNRGRCAATVSFDVIFRAARSEENLRRGLEQIVEERHRLAPGERKTGENDGLFYIPFPEGESIAEVGLRGVSVRSTCP